MDATEAAPRAAPRLHIVLSPHLDDAVLSCGATLAMLARGGAACVVVTVCAGQPPASFPFSAWARDAHRGWGLPDESAIALRRAEDVAAMAVLGVGFEHLDLYDAIYWRNASQRTLAQRARARLAGLCGNDRRAIAGMRAREMRAAIAPLRERWRDACWWAPLGIGWHPDHLAVHAAAVDMIGAGLRCYEDVPYVLHGDERVQRLRELGDRWRPLATPIDDAALGAKIAAAQRYNSQLVNLFPRERGDPATQLAALARSTDASAGMFERAWVLG